MYIFSAGEIIATKPLATMTDVSHYLQIEVKDKYNTPAPMKLVIDITGKYVCHIYPKYWDILTPYYTCPKI